MKPNKICKRSFIMTIALVAVFALAAAQPCAAATLTVTSTADDGSGTLRAALASAVDGDTINFGLTLPATISLTSGALVVDKSVTITGPGQDQLKVDGGNNSGVFQVWDKTVTISGLTIVNGWTTFVGGGILNYGTLTLSDCTLSGNYARGGGGGVYTEGPLRITRCTLRDNESNVTEDISYGGGAVAFVAGSADAALTIESSRLINNKAREGGGGISVEGDHASVTVINSTLSDNSAPEGRGGAILNSAFGGGTTLALKNTTLSGNSAGAGGAIVNEASFGGSAMVTVDNCTLSGNSALVLGGAMFNTTESGGSAIVTVDNCTLSGNDDASDSSSGIANVNGGGTLTEVNIKNTILANNPSGANLVNIDGVIVSSGYNVSTDNGGSFLTATGDMVNTDPLLGSLADNGGPTLTHALLDGSPAIDAGSSTDIAGNTVTTDQRGVARPQGSANDIGAFEVEAMGYQFIGFTAPVDNPDVMNIAKAGQTIPLKWRLLYSDGTPVTDLASVSVTVVSLACSAGTTTDAIEEYGAGASGLQNLGDGYYQWNWKTPATYANSCKTLKLDLGEGAGNEHTALFQFKR